MNRIARITVYIRKKVTIMLINQAQNDTTGDRSYQDRHKAKKI